MNLSNLTKEKVIEILKEYGYIASGEIEPDNYVKYVHKDFSAYPAIYLGNSCIESDAYSVAYDYKYEGCENGLRSYILGAYSDEEEI